MKTSENDPLDRRSKPSRMLSFLNAAEDLSPESKEERGATLMRNYRLQIDPLDRRADAEQDAIFFITSYP